MSPAVWILIVFVGIFLAIPAMVFLINAEPETVEREGNPDTSPGTDSDQPESPPAESDTESNDSAAPSNEQAEPSSENPTEETETDDPDLDDSLSSTSEDELESGTATGTSWSYAEKYNSPVVLDGSGTLNTRFDPNFDTDLEETYDDRNSPDNSSDQIQSAVEWLVQANTEAIHQQSKLNDFLDNLEAFIEEPRAAGAEAIAKTPWREQSPNLSRLIGERLLVLSLGLSANLDCEMDAHRTAFRELLADTWNDDGLDHPLLYQGIGRMGLLTPTPYVDLKNQLIERIPGRTPRSDDPDRLEIARYHALLFAVSPEEGYPFPRSDRGLSRLWHWDEHNPPLADWILLPTILYSLWIHHANRETDSDAANDFGALLGNWWDENEPNETFFRSKPGIWEAILLTAWVLLPGHKLIWNQLEDRFDSLEVESGGAVEEMTEKIMDWVNEYNQTGERPENTPSREDLPPSHWITPMPSELLDDFSQPSFGFPRQWCEELNEFSPSREPEEISS